MRRLGLIVCVLALTALSLPLRAATVVPDFRLEDVNTESVRYDTIVSPRDYVLQVSGYYFGHAS